MSLENNTAGLEEILASVNALPEAGSGGGVTNETCEVTISAFASNYCPKNIAYTSVDNSGKVIGVNQDVSTLSVTITCVKGSTLAVKFKYSFSGTTLTNASLLFYTSPLAVYKLDDNATTAEILNGSQGAGGSV